jgi:hypothetical protein
VARLLLGKESFTSVSSTAFFESEYEAIILSRAAEIFPEYWAAPFKFTVESEKGKAKADLALIQREYKNWWVVEVELAHHPLGGHVLPQVDKLANAKYGADVAEYLKAQLSGLDLEAVRRMLKGRQPQVVVVVNRGVPTWNDALSGLGALLMIVEVFRSDRNVHVLRINGDYPEAPVDVLSRLRPDPAMPRLFIVDSPGAIDTPADQRLELEFDGAITEWTRVDTASRVWLSPVVSNPLAVERQYVIVRSEDNRLVIQDERRERNAYST